MKQQEYFDFGSLENLKDILEYEKSRNVFLVTGRDSYEKCGAKEKIETILGNSEIGFTRFCDFFSNPNIKDIQKGCDSFKKKNYDLIMGVGGGSVIDTAKAIKLFNCPKAEKIPLIAIPTTAGSGSEATWFVVFYKGKEKQSWGNETITLPNYSVIDPKLTMSLSRKVAASTGMDALAQAVESYWCINSTDESKRIARQSIKLTLKNLERAVNGKGKRARGNMALSSNLAGKAINLTRTTACHSIAYPITSYFDVAHGHAVGLTLGEMLTYNSKVTEGDCNDGRGFEYARKTINELVEIFEVGCVDGTSRRIKNLMDSIGLETRLSEIEIGEQGREIIIDKGFKPERVKNNPRILTRNGLRKILEKIA